jgi:hypothetical protein
MRPHDLEEFNIIVRRYGLWRADVQLFLEAIKHPDLFSNDDDNRDYERATVAAESDRLTRGANG